MTSLRLRLVLGVVAALVAVVGLVAVALAQPAPGGDEPPASAPAHPDPSAEDPAGPEDPADPPAAECSGAEILVAAVVPDGVPAPTAERMLAIIAAAQSCDYLRLAELALDGGSTFTASFGDDFTDTAALAAFWQRLEEEGEPVTAILVRLLVMETFETVATDASGAPVAIHVAPRAMADDATRADWDALADVFGHETVARWTADGMYLGWRVGITADGDWRFFVAGD